MDCITDSMDISLSKLQEMVKDRGAWRAHQLFLLMFPAPGNLDVGTNQSILNYSLEGLICKLKLPILWPPDVKN